MEQQQGFTLIEMMIVVAIIGILSAIAMPYYGDYVKRGKIVDAVTALSDTAVKLEQYYQDKRTYVGACKSGSSVPDPGTVGVFSIACDPLDVSAFTVTATGSGVMDGFVFTINQNGVRKTTSVGSGWTAPTSDCWATEKGGRC